MFACSLGVYNALDVGDDVLNATFDSPAFRIPSEKEAFLRARTVFGAINAAD